MDPLALTPPVLSSFQITKSFNTNQASLTSLSFDDTGDLCITSAQDDSLNVYDCKEGRLRTTLFSKRYGTGLTRFTHQASGILHASTKEDDSLRYLSLHDNKYIRYFQGHKDRVISLEISPLDDQLISASLDGTVRLWDLRSPICEGLINTNGRPIAAIDNAGLVFGVGLNSEVLRLYDIRSFDTGPFATWAIPDYRPFHTTTTSTTKPYWTSLKFTNDGQHIIIATSTGTHYVVHAFEGHVVKRLSGPDAYINLHYADADALSPSSPSPSCGEEISVSPDARYVFSGGTRDGVVRVWDLLKDVNVEDSLLPPPAASDCVHYPIVELQSHSSTAATHPSSTKTGINVLGFNPALMMMVSGGKELDFWQPIDISS
ncbi:WD40-repeat-containing domain protein [Absidia repens]|uniref:WD40-repeat-containing domain protein n=1 Tax=Absidia repens TaxID=90262 RepID=A0A1X2IYY1_9FUNG|nr:WD40-repeat-containing domain protein [Absidia repens]